MENSQLMEWLKCITILKSKFMQNYILSNIRTCVPYIKELRNIAGSVTASILMQQLDYWFSKQGGEPFYKFKAPCEHSMYKKGDSFIEELGFSVEEFTNAFLKVGTVYKSKTEFEASQDKFAGKYYCCYFDRKESLTFYFRNHNLLDVVLKRLFTVNGESPFIETDKVHLQKPTKSISPIYITEDYNNRLQQNNKQTNATAFSPSFEKPTAEKNLALQSSISEFPNNLHTQKQNIQTMQFQKFWNLYEKPKKAVNWNAANVKQAEKLFIYALKQCESFEWLMRNTEDYLTVKSTGKHGEGVKRGICSFLSKRDFPYLINWNEKLQEIKGIDPKNTVVKKQDQEKVQEEKQAKKEVNNADYQATTSKLQKLNAEKLCNDIQQSITASMSDIHKHFYDFQVLNIFEKNDSIFLGIQTKSEPNQAFAEKLQNILQMEAQFCFGAKYKKFKILYKIN